jgi:hypothetical protein
MHPYEAPSLVRLKKAIDARWPGRDHTSDGWIGDEAHQQRKSDHNPDPVTGVVRARDIDRDGIHVPTVLAAVFIHPTTRYVIHARKIWHHDNRFKPKTYTGANHHDKHIHDSIEHTKAAENSSVPWKLISTVPQWGTLRMGTSGQSVSQLQAYLNGHGAALVIDATFGAGTRAAVYAFQRKQKLKVDGVVGPQTLKALRTR